MRRWNGWGDEAISFPLPEEAHSFIAERIGKATPLPEATLDEVLSPCSSPIRV